MLTGDNGILTQANKAKTETEYKGAEEKVKLAIMAARSQSERGTLEAEKLVTEVTTNYGGQAKTTAGGFPVTVTIDGKSFIVSEDGTIEFAGAKPVITNAKVTTDAEGKNVATSNTPEGTTLYITFGATLEKGTITKVVDNDGNKEMTAVNGIYSKAVIENRKYTFTIIGTGENGEVTTNATVQVKEFENKIKTGTVVSLISTKGTTEEFYVLSYDESTQKAKALAKYNLMIGKEDINADKYGLQDSGQEGKGTVAFSSSRYWDDTYKPQGSSDHPWVYNDKSNLYQYVEQYKTLLGNTDKVSEVSLASDEDIAPLRRSNWNYPWYYSTSYWLGSAEDTSSDYIVCVRAGSVNSSLYKCSNNWPYGVRPVITVDMSKI